MQNTPAPSTRQLNWDNLRIFLAVARTQSALEAAARLEMDHSTISRRLHRLEKEIGSTLFARNPQGHVLTTAGHRLLEYVEKIEGTLAQIDSEIGGESQVLTGQVRLGATEGFGSFFLAPQLAHFCARHPAITVEVLAVPRFINLSKREADLAINIERPQTGAYVFCKLADYRLQIYATAGYLEKHPPICSLADLASHSMIGYVDELSFSTELRYLQQLAPGAPVPLRSTSIIAQFCATRRGQGLAVLPCFLASSAPDLVPVLPGTAEVIRSFWLVAPQERHQIARVRALWDFLRHAVETNRAFLMGESHQIVWSE
ncbi:MAG: LysR family transcriptional regulator [Noviherbaspirillum sp.]